MGFSGAAALRIFQCICNVQIFLLRKQLQVVGALPTEQCQTRSVKHDKGSRTMRRAGEAFSQPVASRIYSLAWEFFRFLGSQIKSMILECQLCETNARAIRICFRCDTQLPE